MIVTPMKGADPFNAYFPLMENDPILLGEVSKGESITDQLSRQLRGYEMEFNDASLFQDNMSHEFTKLMAIYDQNHETLQEFKNRF